MGSFLSRKKKKEGSDSSTTKDEHLKSVDAAIYYNREKICKMEVGMTENNTIVNQSGTTAFIPNQNNFLESYTTQRRLNLPRVDFKVLENESPTERRRRIMSGDRRISYVMKLESLRREQFEKKLTEKNCDFRHRKFMKSLIQPENVKPDNIKLTDVDKSENCNDNFQIPHYQVDLNKNLINNTYGGTNFYKSNQIVTETNMEKSAEEENFTSNLDNCDNNGLERRNTSVLNEVSFKNNDSMCSNNNKIINENKLHKSNIDVKQNTCTKMNKNVLNCNPMNCLKGFEINTENFPSSSQEVINDSVDVKTQTSDKLSTTNVGTIESNNPKDKTSVDFYKMPRHIHKSNETNNSNNVTVSTSEFRKKPSKITVGYDSMITFESDYSYHEFESDIKSDFTESINLKDPSLSVVVPQETSSSSSLSTLLSYNKVKKLFQKRISEIELYEKKKKNKNSTYYKELEALGRGRWENDVWIPSGKLRATLFHDVCKKRD